MGLPAFAGNNILSCNSSLPLVLTSPSWSEHTVKPAAAPGRQPELADAPALNSQNWIPAKTQCPAKKTNCNYLKNHSSFVRPFIFSKRRPLLVSQGCQNNIHEFHARLRQACVCLLSLHVKIFQRKRPHRNRVVSLTDHYVLSS